MIVAAFMNRAAMLSVILVEILGAVHTSSQRYVASYLPFVIIDSVHCVPRSVLHSGNFDLVDGFIWDILVGVPRYYEYDNR